MADPRATATDEDYAAQFAFVLETRDLLSRTHNEIGRIRSLRDQLDVVQGRLEGNGDDPVAPSVLLQEVLDLQASITSIEETRNPRSSLPRALVFTVVAVAALYFFVMLVFVSVIPTDEYAAVTLVDVARRLAGPVGAVASSVSRLLAYISCIAALPAVRRSASEEVHRTAFRIRGGFLIPLVALLVCFWLLLQTKTENWVAVGLLLLVGLSLYLLERWLKR
ncbi:MAG: amino acid transporter [Halieaceae bacterium]